MKWTKPLGKTEESARRERAWENHTEDRKKEVVPIAESLPAPLADHLYTFSIHLLYLPRKLPALSTDIAYRAALHTLMRTFSLSPAHGIQAHSCIPWIICLGLHPLNYGHRPPFINRIRCMNRTAKWISSGCGHWLADAIPRNSEVFNFAQTFVALVSISLVHLLS